MPKSHDAKPRNRHRRQRAQDHQVISNKSVNPWWQSVWLGVTRSLYTTWDQLGLLKHNRQK